LVSAEFSLLSYWKMPLRSILFFLLKYIIPEALPPALMGSALASGGSILELAGIGFVYRKFPAVSHRSHPCNTPRYQNLAMQTKHSYK